MRDLLLGASIRFDGRVYDYALLHGEYDEDGYTPISSIDLPNRDENGDTIDLPETVEVLVGGSAFVVRVTDRILGFVAGRDITGPLERAFAEMVQ